jgi:lipopolysaccharide transport system permease protein
MNKNPNSFSQSAVRDWWDGTKKVEIWFTLSWFDILLRYRRSMLGPFWITLSMAAMIAGMGPLYSSLFGTDLKKFFPHLALGLIFWSLLSSVINDSCSTLIGAQNYIKQSYFPIAIFIWRNLSRNIIQFLHHIILYIPVAWWAGIQLDAASFLVFPALLVFLINAHALGIVLGLLCTRFRDVTQIVVSVMQMLMFLTPVFWLPESVPDRAKYILWNPLAEMLDLLRRPLMGEIAPLGNWIGMAIWSTLTITSACILFTKYRRRVVYWL